jgi:ABC-type amino acid transport substrate-binding protein
LFDFSAPIYEGGGGLFVRAPGATPKDLAALFGKTVVTPRTGPLAGLIERTAPHVNLVVTANYEESLGRLTRGDADAAALNYHVGAMLAARLYPGKVTIPPIFFTQNPVALGVRKAAQVELLNRMNAELAAVRADGTWQKINDRAPLRLPSDGSSGTSG